MGIYEENIIIKGRHATRMKMLAAKFDGELSQGIFARNLDVYMAAPIVGKVYGRRAKIDTDVDDSTSIHVEQMNKEMDTLLANFRTIAMLEKRDEIDIDTRTSNAFRHDRDDENRKPMDIIFEEYVLGGIDVLYEKLMENAKNTDDYIVNMFYFVDEFETQYKERFDFDAISELCKVSKK